MISLVFGRKYSKIKNYKLSSSLKLLTPISIYKIKISRFDPII